MIDNVTRIIGSARIMIALVGLAPLALAGCARGSFQDALGLGKRVPDEFSVVQRAPLTIPPDFELRPPRPGEARPQTGTTSDQARAALVGPPATNGVAGGGELGSSGLSASELGPGISQSGLSGARPVPGMAQAGPSPAQPVPGAAQPVSSAGQQALLAEAGGDNANPEIRTQIAEENQSLARVEQALFTRVMRWREPNTLSATVDAPAEAERLRANKAKGAPPTAGDTPTVVERRQSPLGALVQKVF